MGASMARSCGLLLDGGQAAELVGVCRRQWARWDAAELVPDPVSVGGRRRWRRAEIEDWVSAGCQPRRQWRVLRAADGRRRTAVRMT